MPGTGSVPPIMGSASSTAACSNGARAVSQLLTLWPVTPRGTGLVALQCVKLARLAGES